jgi:mannonate dehydratase
MRLALSVVPGQDDQLIIAQQLGVEDVFVSATGWDQAALAAARHRVEQVGLELAGVEGLPGGPEAAPGAACQAIAAAGRAGIEAVAYRWPGAVGSAARVATGRGEATVRRGRPVDPPEAEWQRWSDWLREAVPVAEAAGVRLAGAAPFAAVADLDRAASLHASACHGLDLDLGALALAAGPDPVEALRRLVPSGRIHAVQVGNAGPDGEQRFLDEGRLDLPVAVLELRQAGYAGSLRAGPPPGMVGDTDWGHKGRAYDLGYLRALLQAVGRR